MNRPRIVGAAILLALFGAWTVAAFIGLGHGSRRSVWLGGPYGAWPASVESIKGSSDFQFSIFATYADARSGGSPASPVPDGVGFASVGSRIDDADANNINGSRAVTGIRAGALASISVYIAGPIDAAPNDQFELAIYTDSHGAPHRLLARAGPGSLVADSWNTLPIVATLEPQTAYWLLYTANGTSGAVNNLTYTPVVVSSIDSVFRWRSTAEGRHRADQLTAFGGNVPVGAAVLALAAYTVVRRRRTLAAVSVLGAYATALLVALALREVLFDPYRLYPSGHALRITFLAVSLVAVFPRVVVRVAGAVGVLAVCVAANFGGRHFADEIIGGALLGGGMALLATALAAPSRRRRTRFPDLDLSLPERVIDLREVPAPAHPG